MKQRDLLAPDNIYLGNCVDILPRVRSDSIRLIHTSPPYNIGRKYSAYADSKPRREYLEFVSQVIDECFRILLPGGSLFWQTGYTSEIGTADHIYPLDHLTFDVFLHAGFRLKDRIIWRYFGGMAFKKKFTNKHETILWWVKPGGETYFDVFPVREKSKEYDARNNLFGRNPGNVWEVDRVAFGTTEQSSHVAVFPEEISERVVLSCSKPGDLCLDPFSGSGTLCRVAKCRGRGYIGIEIDQRYLNESLIRLGFCQSNEFDNVLSQLLKEHVFQKENSTWSIERAADRLLQVLPAEEHSRVASNLSPEQLSVIVSFNENGVSKSTKADIWRQLDDYFADRRQKDAVRMVDSAHLSCFKLNKVYNSPMRYALARRWLDEYRNLAKSKAELIRHIQLVISNEPSSYQVHGTSATLKSMHRDIRAIQRSTPDSPGKSTPKEQLNLAV